MIWLILKISAEYELCDIFNKRPEFRSGVENLMKIESKRQKSEGKKRQQIL